MVLAGFQANFTLLAVVSSVVIAVTTAVVFYVAKALYDAFFHPLRHYPGPLRHKISRIPFIWASVTGCLFEEVQKLHETYGDVVRIAPDELSYTNPVAWRDIYGHKPQGAREMEKYHKFYNPNQRAQHIITATREVHGRQRRLLSNGFSEKAIRDQEPLIRQYVDLLIKRLHENCSDGAKSLDLVLWYNWTTFDIIGDLAFGEPFGCLDKSDYHPWVAMIFASIKIGALFQASAHYPLLKKLIVSMAPKSLMAKRDAHFQLIREKVARRMAIDTERPDFFGSILRKKDEMDMSVQELQGNANILILAGSETTATLLSGVTYFLVTNPQAMEKLEEEVRSAFSNEDEINVTSVNKLTYMLACLDEALRMYPPAPAGLPRVVPKGGAIIADKFVPESTVVSVANWAINHDYSNFTDPWTYAPERFLGDQRFALDKREALQPFSVGPRNCLGRNLAYTEMRLILARLIFNFDMRIAPESNEWLAKQKAYTLWEKRPLMVYLTPKRTT